MNISLKEISQISIYLKGKAERINEIALFQPLNHKTEFEEESKPIHQRRWSYTSNLPFFLRLSLKVQKFLFKRFPILIPKERATVEAKFKTVLALLLAQETIRDFFLSDPAQKDDFFNAIVETAQSFGYSLSIPSETHPLNISRQLTWLPEKNVSLIDDMVELNIQMATLSEYERNEMLFRILNTVKRPPITSVVEVMKGAEIESIPLTTKYAKYKIVEFDQKRGEGKYLVEENHATSSIRTLENMRPGARGAINQRLVLDAKEKIIGAYSGELSTPFHVLEQILFLLDQTDQKFLFLEHPPPGAKIEEKKILFTSLYSWNEFNLITSQYSSIKKWDQQILNCGGRYYRLHLLYLNVSFNALNKYPTPGEMGAAIKDLNEEALIYLTFDIFKKLGIESTALNGIAVRCETLQKIQEDRFLEKRKALLEEIDRFRKLKKELITLLDGVSSPLAEVMILVLEQKKSDGRSLKGMDLLLHLDVLAKQLGYIHNKNCQNSTDRSAGADAADKAAYTYQKIKQSPFLPGVSKNEELALFKVLYSMYLVWEEPEITAALSTGFLGEKFYHNFFQKNPETTRYLIHWLKKHPEMYLGLSDLRR